MGLRGARCRQWLPRVQMPLLTCVFQIILVSSSLSDRDQSLFLSADEGATFQKQLVPFSVETLIFHPQEEDKVLAYAKEGKVSRPGSPEGREPPHHPSPGSPGRQEGSAGLGPGPPQPLLPGAGVGDPITPAPGAGVRDPLSPCSPGLGSGTPSAPAPWGWGRGPHHPLLPGAGAGTPSPLLPGLGSGTPSAPAPQGWGRDPITHCSPRLGMPSAPAPQGWGRGPHHLLLLGPEVGDPLTPCSPGLGSGTPSPPAPRGWGWGSPQPLIPGAEWSGAPQKLMGSSESQWDGGEVQQAHKMVDGQWIIMRTLHSAPQHTPAVGPPSTSRTFHIPSHPRPFPPPGSLFHLHQERELSF